MQDDVRFFNIECIAKNSIWTILFCFIITFNYTIWFENKCYEINQIARTILYINSKL